MSEQNFVRELERRADHVHGASFSFADVRGRARSIQRRRRATAAAAVAAAVAVVAVVPAVLAGHDVRSDGPDPAPPVPVPSAHTAVLHEGGVDLPDGRSVHVGLDNADVSQLGFLTDGRILAATSRPMAIRVISTTDHSTASYPVTTNALAVSADDRLAAWVDQAGHVQVLEAGHPDPVRMADVPARFGSPPSVAAVTGADCANGGCRVLVGDTTTWGAATSEGYEEVLAGQQLRVTDINPDGSLWAVQTQATTDHELGCAGLYDPAAGRLVARDCQADNLRFSPDGQHLLSAYGENNLMVDPAVFDLDLNMVTPVKPTEGGSVVSRMAWVDPTHLLASTVDLKTRDWVLERIDLSGHEEVLAGQSPGPAPELANYVLSD